MKEKIIHPMQQAASGRAEVPGSKSITNRALLLGYLSKNKIELRNVLYSEDTLAMIEALGTLGVEVQSDPPKKCVTIMGCGGKPPQKNASLNVKNAGTVARFLTAALTVSQGGDFLMDGTEAMRKRPMKGLLDALVEIGGATVDYQRQDGHFPFRLQTNQWKDKPLPVDAGSSSQILSALLMAACGNDHSAEIRLTGPTVSRPFIDMTLRMIHDFGGRVDAMGEDGYRVHPRLKGPKDNVYFVEPDATAASYFWALPLATGGKMSVAGFPPRSLQGDLAFVDILPELGMQVRRKAWQIETSLTSRNLSTDERVFDFNPFSDTFLTLAAVAPLLPYPVHIKGIAHTRHQESDRVDAMATQLRKLGQQVEETGDSLRIHGSLEKLRESTRNGPVDIETYKDHRVAMSFAILGLHDLHGDGRPWINILDPRCTEKTFPDFFEELARIASVSKTTSST